MFVCLKEGTLANFVALNAQNAKINEVLETQFVTSNQEQSNLTEGLPSLQQFEVMISGADIGSFSFYNYGGQNRWVESPDLVRHILKRFSVGLGLILKPEDYGVVREKFVEKLLSHLHKVMGKKPRLVKDSDFDTINYS